METEELKYKIVKAISSSTYNSIIVKDQKSQEVIDARVAAAKCEQITIEYAISVLENLITRENEDFDNVLFDKISELKQLLK